MSTRIEQQRPAQPRDKRSQSATPPSGRHPTLWNSAGVVALIAAREIVTQLRRREFWGSLIITAIVVVASVGAQALFAGGPSTYHVAVVNTLADPGRPNLLAALQAQAPSGGGDLVINTEPSDTDAESRVRNGIFDAAVLADGSVIYLDQLPGPLDEVLRTAAASAATRSALARQGLTEAQISAALSVQPLRLRALDPDAHRHSQRIVLAFIAIMALFFLMLTFGQAIAHGVLEEKSSRIVEVLLAKVRATQLLAGKVLGMGVVVLIQILFLVICGFVAAVSFDLLAIPTDAVKVVLVVLLWFVPGYLLCATLWAVAGALVSRPEDLTNAAGPVSFVMTIGMLGTLFLFTGAAPAVSAALSMLPGFSWSMMPVRMASETVPWWQTGIAIALLALAIAVLLRVAGRIYVGGLLNHGGLLTARAALRNANESGQV